MNAIIWLIFMLVVLAFWAVWLGETQRSRKEVDSSAKLVVAIGISSLVTAFLLHVVTL